ncbi:MAG: hypothetical protein ABIR33_03295 [Pyrinomonadaceae bacterium]
MTVKTQALFGSRYASIGGLLTILCFLSFDVAAQASGPQNIGSDREHEVIASQSDSETPDPARELATHGPSHRLLISQTETKRRPNLPSSVLQGPVKEPHTSVDQQFTEKVENALVEKPVAPAWHPFDHLPRESRFIKDNASDADPSDEPSNAVSQKFHWKPAILQSVLIQGFQLSYALVIQEKTRRALKGPFFRDYWDSIKGTKGWSDGNKFFTNYIAHPMQGGMTGFIFVQNHDRAKKQIFAESKQYWKDRLKAFAWSAAWSANWEFGPVSQSSIGNVGLYGHQGYVDSVITPTVGTGWLLTEEALDRYLIRHLEMSGPKVKKLLRTFLNPMRSVANLLRFKEPWYRDRPYGH